MAKKGLFSVSLGTERATLAESSCEVAEGRHCPPVASWQGTPTRSWKTNRKRLEGTPAVHMPPRNTGGDVEGGLPTPQVGGHIANAVGVLTTKTITVTSSADT